MRPFLALPLLAVTPAARADEPPVIAKVYEVLAKQGEREVSASGVIDRRSTLKVQLDGDALRRRLLQKYPQAGVEEPLRKSIVLANAALEGARGLPALAVAFREYRASTPENGASVLRAALQAVARPAKAIVDAANGDLELRGRLIQRLEALPDGASVFDQNEAIFDEATRYAEELRRAVAAKLAESGVRVEGRLRLRRDESPSRTTDADVFAPLSDDEKALLSRLSTLDADLKQALDQARTLLQTQVPTAIGKLADDLAKSAQALAQTLGDAAGGVPDDLASKPVIRSAKEAVDDVVAKAKALKALATNPGNDPAAALSGLNAGLTDLATRSQAVASGLARVRAEFPRLVAAGLGDLKTRLETALRDQGEPIVKQLLGASEAAAPVIGSLRRLTDLQTELTEIGRQVQAVDPAQAGKEPLVFANTFGDGRVEPRSGDRIDLEIVPIKKDGKDDAPLDRREFYAYTIGARIDRIVSLIFAEADDGDSFRPSPSYSLLFKKAGRGSLYRNEFGQIGIGVNFAALDLDRNDSIEIGIGGVASFLNDFVQVGYGYNVTINRGYFFFGFRIPIRV